MKSGGPAAYRPQCSEITLDPTTASPGDTIKIVRYQLPRLLVVLSVKAGDRYGVSACPTVGVPRLTPRATSVSTVVGAATAGRHPQGHERQVGSEAWGLIATRPTDRPAGHHPWPSTDVFADLIENGQPADHLGLRLRHRRLELLHHGPGDRLRQRPLRGRERRHSVHQRNR